MIALGSHVTFTHRAAVARRRGFNDYPKHGEEPRKPIWMWREWELTEPKTWPQEGSGVVVGLKRKQFGQSHGSTGADEDFDPGYFESFGQVSLYVVKAELLGPEVYVPEICIHLAHAT